MNGFNHFARLNLMTGYAKSKGIPAPAFAVGGSGVLLFLGGLSLLLGYHPTIGVGLLVIFRLGVSFGRAERLLVPTRESESCTDEE